MNKIPTTIEHTVKKSIAAEEVVIVYSADKHTYKIRFLRVANPMKGFGHYQEWMLDLKDSDIVHVDVMEEMIRHFKKYIHEITS